MQNTEMQPVNPAENGRQEEGAGKTALHLAEQFVSINGEGVTAGQLALFFRFCGCNLSCSYCDTAWANAPDCPYEEKTAEEVHNFVRGLSPYPAAWANLTIHGQEFQNVKIFKVEISKYRNIEISKSDIIIPCREGAVRILELQVPGKKRMDARSFLNGLH